MKDVQLKLLNKVYSSTPSSNMVYLLVVITDVSPNGFSSTLLPRIQVHALTRNNTFFE